MGVSDRCLMTWDKSKHRWKKLHKGKWYRVTCTELLCEPTKEASYLEANAWWRAKQAQIESQQRQEHPHAETLRGLARKRDWMARHGDHEARAGLDADIAKVSAMGEADDPTEHDPSIGQFIRLARMFGVIVPDDLDPVAARAIFGQGRIWQDRFRRDQTTSVPEENTLQGLSARFLELSAARVAIGDLSQSEHQLAVLCVGHAVEFFGPGNEPTVINAERWEGYWKHLLLMIATKKRSTAYALKDWRYAKTFIRWMAGMNKMTLPANIDSRHYRFGDGANAIEPFSIEQVQKLVSLAQGQLRLHLLLMLNCGMYQGDISDLKHSEVDWERGTITRKRSKTKKKERVPTVTYTLWPVTFDLLKQYRSSHPVLALTMEDGQPWVERRSSKGHRDSIEGHYRHINVYKKPLKLIRKTSASMLDDHPEFGRYAEFFLGHAPKSILDKHYRAPSQEQFNAALEWLRGRYGF